LPRASRPGAEPAASSMFIDPEPGGAPQGMLHAIGDDPERPWSGLDSGRLANPAGQTYFSRRLRGHAAIYPGSSQVKTTPRLLKEAGLPAEKVLAPSQVAPQDWQPAHELTEGQKLRLGAAAAIAVLGLLFLAFGTRIVEATAKRPPADRL